MSQHESIEADIFHQEEEVLALCQVSLLNDQASSEELRKDFDILAKAYRKMLRQTRKITRVGDSIQRKLVKARGEIEIKNKHLMEAQQQLVLKEKMLALNTLTNGVAHEISNPLNFINNFAKLHLQTTKEMEKRIEGLVQYLDEDDQDYLKEDLQDLKNGAEIIWEHGVRAARIVDSMVQLTSLFREDHGSSHPVQINHLMETYANSVIRNRAEAMGLGHVVLKAEPAPQDPLVDVVPEDLGTVFTQLLFNALEALAERLGEPDFRPILAYTILEHDDTIEIRLGNNGPCIDPHVREKIFTPFFTTRECASNIGLGLPTCYDIVVNGYQGELKVSSDDNYTTFTVELPKWKNADGESIAPNDD